MNDTVVVGYKVFNPDWTCMGFQYEVGKHYIHDGDVKECRSGFHFCEYLADCFSYYPFNPKNKVAIVEASGKITKRGSDCSKRACSELFVREEITWEEVLRLCNTGSWNAGYGNTGNWNTGYGNTGNWNTGNRNAGSWNNGYFNTTTPDVIDVFNKSCSREEFNKWDRPDFLYFTTVDDNGNALNYKEQFQKAWKEAPEEEKDQMKKCPNFDPDVFYEISGIRV